MGPYCCIVMFHKLHYKYVYINIFLVNNRNIFIKRGVFYE